MQAHHHSREQRRAKRIAVALLLIVVVVGGAIVFFPDERLALGMRLGLVPGEDAEKLYDGGDPVELIVLATEVPKQFTLPELRYEAVFIAERTANLITLHDLNRTTDVVVPLDHYDLISASSDRSAIMFVDRTSGSEAQAVLVTIATGQVEELPPGETDPGIPGDWNEDIGGTTFTCDGVSPNATLIACISHGRAVSRFIFGRWEIRISPYGNLNEKESIYRGGGIDPVAGWSADERWIYFQNEKGTYRVEVSNPSS
jgi:hypothetical protein